MSWLYHRPIDGTIAFLEAKFASKPAIAEANVKAFKAGWAYGETTEDFVVSYEVEPATLAPGTYRNITGNQALGSGSSRRACRAGCRSSSAPTRSRPPRRSSSSSRATSTSASAPSRPRTRSPPSGAALGAQLRRRARRQHLERPRRRAQGRDGRPGGRARAAAGHRRHPARRAVDRDADEAGAGRPADGALRPQRRVARAGGRRVDAGRLLRGGARGGAHRAQVPHAGLPALRRLPRQRLGAVADPRRRRAARTSRSSSRPSRTATASSSPTCATPRRSRARGRCPARRGSSTGSAGWRRRT